VLSQQSGKFNVQDSMSKSYINKIQDERFDTSYLDYRPAHDGYTAVSSLIDTYQNMLNNKEIFNEVPAAVLWDAGRYAEGARDRKALGSVKYLRAKTERKIEE